MSSAFTEIAKEVANEFLQSIVFIDDRAFLGGNKTNHHAFDALQITRAFAKSRKVCAVYKPETIQDIDNLAQLAKKADITVIDWQIHITESITEENSEEDAEEDDPRGPHTRRIIREIISDPITGKDSLKLILIYTGEIGLYDITDAIFDDLSEQGIEGVTKGDCQITTDNVKIIVVAKPSIDDKKAESKFKHNPKLKGKIVAYVDLPDFILSEFTKMTSGLVSNVALSAITSIRKNNFKLLQLYSREMDPAFLAHRAMLPEPDNAGDLLKESILNSFDAILDYDSVKELCSYGNIKNWLDDHSFADQQLRIQSKDLTLKVRELKGWQKGGFHNAMKGIWQRQFPNTNLNTQKIESKYKDLHKDWGSYFIPDSFEPTEHHEKFSILTHHKSNFVNPTYTPKLSLGTVIRGKKSGIYWLCIQQKCDSVRIPKGEARRFLFLPLDEISVNGKFNFLIETENGYIKLKIDFSSHKLRTIKFKANKDGIVSARRYGSSRKYFFHPIYFKSGSNRTIHQNYIWIMDLKESHAQRVANHYASVLSRVGLDESEWLRRWST